MKKSMRLRGAMSLAAAGALMLPAGMASAAPYSAHHHWPRAYTCHGGIIPSGTYASITVAGNCSVPAHARITVKGNLNVRKGAMLDADSAPSTITIRRNVVGWPGSSIGLGCTSAHGGCTAGGPDGNGPYAGEQSTVLIKGSVWLNRVYNAALDGITVRHSVTSLGGGSGMNPPGFIPFSVKDDVIGGNLTVIGLTSVWFGAIRSTIGGNVTLIDNYLLDPDANEVVHNSIGKNLVCLNNYPAPQIGDAGEGQPPGYAYSTVGKRVYGQCGFVLAPS
ncbi:hypothetical protein [Flexivirga lutea]